MNIVLFGAGKFCHKLLLNPVKDNCNISFICDNNQEKWGGCVGNYEILPPERLLETSFDFVILAITGQYWQEVYKQLIDFGIDKNKIITVVEYSKFEYVHTPLDDFFDIKKKIVPFVKNKVFNYGKCGGETSKAHKRREKEGFFEKYCKGEGLDIGCGADPVVSGCSGWDLINGDAQYLDGIDDEVFDYVYSSHCLEHLSNVRAALFNWFRVIKKGGFLIIYIPHRDLYEKRKCLPSIFNSDHKHFFLLGKKESPDTLDIMEEIREALVNNDYSVKYAKVCDNEYVKNADGIQSSGEYSIECVIERL